MCSGSKTFKQKFAVDSGAFAASISSSAGESDSQPKSPTSFLGAQGKCSIVEKIICQDTAKNVKGSTEATEQAQAHYFTWMEKNNPRQVCVTTNNYLNTTRKPTTTEVQNLIDAINSIGCYETCYGLVSGVTQRLTTETYTPP